MALPSKHDLLDRLAGLFAKRLEIAHELGVSKRRAIRMGILKNEIASVNRLLRKRKQEDWLNEVLVCAACGTRCLRRVWLGKKNLSDHCECGGGLVHIRYPYPEEVSV